jgi:RHS repeat-associated protein
MTYNYDYSPTGNIIGKSTEQGNYSYQYDNLYRLTQATNAGGENEAYTYDLLGNRLTSANAAGSWAYNENNELISYGDISYEYDSNGNVVKKTDQTGTTNFAYDLDNRLVQLTTSNSQLTTYYYDPFGRRLWKDVNGVRTYFFYSDEGLIGEYDGSGNEIKTYGYAADSVWSTNPMFQKIGTRYYWYQNDHLGSPQTILDTTGRIVWSATYDAVGNIHITNAEIENNLRFPGQYYDGETGLHYNYFRYYDPSTGRYITKDPIGFAGGDVNLYRYVGNNPISIRDPGGLRFLPYHFLETLIAGFLTGHFVKSFVWAYESMAEDWAPGAQSSNLAQNTNIHGLRGRDPVTLQLQTPAEAERGIYQSIIKSASCGKHGQAAHTIQDARAWGHKGQSWEGNNDPVENPSVLRH